MTDDPTMPRSQVKRCAERLFSALIIAQVTALTGLLDVGVTEVQIRRGIVRMALELALGERNGTVGIGGMDPQRHGDEPCTHDENTHDNDDMRVTHRCPSRRAWRPIVWSAAPYSRVSPSDSQW